MPIATSHPTLPRQQHRHPEPAPPVGLMLFVELDPDRTLPSGPRLAHVADELRNLARSLLPHAETRTAMLVQPEPDAGIATTAGDSAVVAASAAAAERRLTTWAADGVRLDPAGRRLVVDGAEVALTMREFELISYLAHHRGRAIGRSELLERVWPAQPGSTTRTVDVHVRRLRQKLGLHSRRITTVRGHGYRLD
ncbi:MAG TPA: winged helix-turn-helix domain-containing protein [Jiangellaceae bacterium]